MTDLHTELLQIEVNEPTNDYMTAEQMRIQFEIDVVEVLLHDHQHQLPQADFDRCERKLRSLQIEFDSTMGV